MLTVRIRAPLRGKCTYDRRAPSRPQIIHVTMSSTKYWMLCGGHRDVLGTWISWFIKPLARSFGRFVKCLLSVYSRPSPVQLHRVRSPWTSWRQRLKANVLLGVVEQTCASSPLHGMYGRRKRKLLTVFQGSRVTEPCLLPMVKSLTFFHGEIDNTQAFQTA